MKIIPLRNNIAIIFSVDRDFDWDKLNLNQLDGNSNRFKPPNSSIYKVTVAMTGVAFKVYQANITYYDLYYVIDIKYVIIFKTFQKPC